MCVCVCGASAPVVVLFCPVNKEGRKKKKRRFYGVYICHRQKTARKSSIDFSEKREKRAPNNTHTHTQSNSEKIKKKNK